MTAPLRSIGRFFQPPETVAGVDLATAETDPDVRERERMSQDGRWWWDGERWLATATPDGLWQWDGETWRPTIELRGVRPRDLATTLALLAEDRYARAAGVLVDREREWRPRGELRELVQRASRMRRRLLGLQHAFAGSRRGRPEDRRRAEEEHLLLDVQYRALMVRLGRHAPRPSVKEADDLLDVARLLDQRAARITSALADADAGERAWAYAIEAAGRELRAAEIAQQEAEAAAAAAREEAERAREAERRTARERLREALRPPAGDPIAEVGPLRVRPASIETPGGCLPTDGTRAWVAPAVALWRQHRDLLEDLLVPETPESADLLRCLTERRRDLFLLLAGRTRTFLWRCPPGEEKPLRRLATAVNREADRTAESAAERRRVADEVLAGLRGDATEPEPAAEADARFAAEVEAARARLERAQLEPPELVAARRRAAAETAAVATPPRPLAVRA